MYLVIFRKRKCCGIDQAAYDRVAEAMEAAALGRPGYIRSKAISPQIARSGAVSEWADVAAARAWDRDAEHLAVQRRGRAEWYSEYTLYGCANRRTHRFEHTQRPAKDTP